ncbi:hypothetical protein [Hydrogenophaga sp. PAMC20947]|uniref:hypothetical protein n=1 Tax=Hydrogenophaga sp. PAMC20947 TaxID=2565558 RepID=UPI001444D6D8|nr:hypothetical protein [Hydrogenophaga sp. PAMC20947]
MKWFQKLNAKELLGFRLAQSLPDGKRTHGDEVKLGLKLGDKLGDKLGIKNG